MTMKKFFISSILVLMSTTFAFASGIEGKWKATVDTDYGPWEFTLAYKVDGDKLSGSFSSAEGDASFTDGVVKGNEFEYKIGANGDSYTHEGTLVNKNEILIKWEHDMYGEGEFTMTRVAE